MKQIKRKSNKIPRTRLPSLQRKTVYQPKVRFFQKIQNSFNLLQQPISSQRNISPQQKRNLQRSFLIKKKFVSNRIQKLAMHKNSAPQSLRASVQKQNHLITNIQSQRTSRVKRSQYNLFLSKIYSKEQFPQYINSKPLGNQQILKYLIQLDDSPIKKSQIHFDNPRDQDENEQDQPLAMPILLNGIINLSKNITQKMKAGKQQYLYNQIMGQVPYQQKYNQFHKKLIQKDKVYKSKKLQLNHKYEWRI